MTPNETLLNAISQMAQTTEDGEDFEDSYAILDAARTMAGETELKLAMDSLYLGNRGRATKERDFMNNALYNREIDKRMRF